MRKKHHVFYKHYINTLGRQVFRGLFFDDKAINIICVGNSFAVLEGYIVEAHIYPNIIFANNFNRVVFILLYIEIFYKFI